MKLRLLGLVLGVMFIGTSAQAGLLIDPYVGMGASAYKVEFDSAALAAVNTDETESSTVFGARIGWTLTLLSLGVDYQMMTFKDDDDDEHAITNTSIFAGVDLPILLRFWAEYTVSSSLELDNVTTTFKDGYAVGIGFTGLPLVSLNLEVEAQNYDIELDNVANSEGTYTLASTIFSVSLPLDL